MCAPLGPSNFDKNTPATRKNLEAPIDDEDDLVFSDGLDAWAIRHIAENSKRLLKRTMMPELVSSAYYPCVRRTEGYPPLLHTKINAEGPVALHCWDAAGAAHTANGVGSHASPTSIPRKPPMGNGILIWPRG